MAYHRYDHYHHRYNNADYAADKKRGQGLYLGLGGGATFGGLVWGVPGAILGGISGAIVGFIVADIIVTFE